jgi:hypothetical protein
MNPAAGRGSARVYKRNCSAGREAPTIPVCHGFGNGNGNGNVYGGFGYNSVDAPAAPRFLDDALRR